MPLPQEMETDSRSYGLDSMHNMKISEASVSPIMSLSLLAAAGAEQDLPASRPQIIVSPRKAAAAAENIKNDDHVSVLKTKMLH